MREDLLPTIGFADIDVPVVEDVQFIPVKNPHTYKRGDIIHVPRTAESMLVLSVNIQSDEIEKCSYGHEHRITEGSIRARRGMGSESRPILKGEQLWILGGPDEIDGEASG